MRIIPPWPCATVQGPMWVGGGGGAGSGCVTQWDCHKWPLTPRGLKQVIRTALRRYPPKSSLPLSPSLCSRTAPNVSLGLPEFSLFFLPGCVAGISANTPVSGSS